VSKHYNDGLQGDEQETVSFLAGWPASATRWNSLDCHADRRFLDAGSWK
jgi:hypothetical protein